MRIAVTLVGTIVVALTLVIAKPHDHGKANSKDINNPIERFLATLDKRAPAADGKTSSLERKALPKSMKSMKETQSFHKTRSTGKLTKLDNMAADINDEVERFLATLDKRAPAAVEKTSSVERKALPKSMKENQSFHKMRSTGKLTKLDNMAADIDDEVERFLATLDKRAPAAHEKTSSVDQKALLKSMKEYQSFHKIRSSGKLAKLGNMAPGKAGLISKVDKKDAPNLKNEKLSSRATKPNGKSIKSDRSAADKHGVVHAKEKKELLKFLNEKLSQKRAKSDGKLKKASVKEFSKTRHVRTECGGSFSGSTGIITSPNYPNNYDNYMDCVYHITVAVGKRITLHFNAFDLESQSYCNWDSLSIHDGSSTNANLLHKLCGDTIPEDTVTSANNATLQFRTDGSNTRPGFSVTYTTLDCGGNFTADSGTISSPNYPDNYENNQLCIYHITVGTGKVINLEFDAFRLESSAHCIYDSLSVYDGSSTTSSSVTAKLCGSDLPEPLQTTGNAATLQFKSDHSQAFSGFLLSYNVNAANYNGCGGAFSGTSGTIVSPNYPNNYDDNMDCVYHITVATGKVIIFTFTDFNLESQSNCNYDSVTVHDGDSINALPLGKFCGSVAPPPTTTSGNSATLRFKTDGSTTRPGFSVDYVASDGANILTGCGGTISGPSGSITSPNYPNNYDNNLDCVYHVTVETGKVILFTFISFGTESHTACNFDSVTVYDGDSTNAPSLGKFCGSDIPPPTATSGNCGTLQLITDGSNTYTGFFVNFVASDSGEVSTTIPSSCGGTFSGSSGTIRSPNYPLNYDDGLDCVYHVTVETGKVIVFTFTDFNLESQSSCNYDSVTVHDGDSINALPLGKFCGSVAPPPTTTSGNSATLRFKTDGSTTLRGFSIDYVASDGGNILTGCGGTSSSPSGSIASPNYPNNYDDNMDCVYYITAETGKVIMFTFTSFDLESHSSCNYDSLTVHDGASINAVSLGKFCGTTIPPPTTTSGNTGTLQFITDGSNTRDGFFVDYVAIDGGGGVTTPPGGCGGTFSGPSGTIRSPNYPDNYDDNMNCVYYVTVETGKVIVFTFTSFELESQSSCNYDSLTVHDGASINAVSLGKFCGSNIPPPTTTSGNSGTLQFKTDGSGTRDGFSISFAASDAGEVTTTAPGSCGGTFSGPSGSITSPNYPNDYANNLDCVYHVNVAAGKVIMFTFNSFNLESHSSCNYDSVTVHDGASTSATTLGKFCGSNLPQSTATSGSSGTLRFKTDSSTTRTGFSASYAAIDAGQVTTAGPPVGCGTSFTAPSGTITSPGYPNHYGNNLDCEYYITVASGSVVQLTFTSFDLENDVSCRYDSLKVFDGNSIFADSLGTFCGTDLPATKFTTYNTATLLLKSDSSVTKTGFSLNYATVELTICGENVIGSSGTISSPNYPTNYDSMLACTWNIQVPAGKIIQFSVTEFDVEYHRTCSHDYVEIMDGSRILGKYCGDLTVGIPASTGNAVTVRMRTNGLGNNKGFSIDFLAVNPPSPSDTSCGLVATPFGSQNRIINGQPAPADTLPYQIALLNDGDFLCGGSVVHESWVLTAAHCVTFSGTYSIVAGSISLDPLSETAQTRTVLRVFSHENYDTDTLENDIALLKLDARLDLSGPSVRAICIPGSDAAVGTACTISGWGNTDTESPNFPDYLLETSLFLRDSSYCGELYSERYNYDGNKQVCGSRHNKDTCQGDSGGPFALLDGRRYFLEGITSYGFGCARPDTPGAYTRTRAFADWVSRTTNGAVTPFSEF